MIKVLELIDGSFIGGGQIHTLSLAKGLDRNEFYPVVAAMGGGEFEKAVLAEGITFKNIYQPKVLRKKYLNPLINFCREEKFDILHSHGGVSGFYGRLVKKYLPGIKVVHSIHGLHYINAGKVKKFISKTIEQYVVKYTDYTICETQQDFTNAKKINVLNPDKALIIPNGIDTTKYGNSGKNENLLAELGIGKDDFVIGNISRFDIQKNQNLIIKTAAELVKKYPTFKFILVGNGRLLEESRKLAKSLKLENNLFFTGEKLNLPDYYSVFDIFVFPTFWEGMPYVLLEAMASGLPIICSDIPSLNEVIENNFSALTINPRSETDLYNAIEKLFNDRNLMKTFSTNAFEASKKYDLKIMVERIENVYREVLRK